MLTPGTKVKSVFKDHNGDYLYGEIVSYQKGDGTFAQGYFTKFYDDNITVFLNKKVIDELYVIIEEKMDEKVFKVNDNGQINFIL